MKLKTSWWSSRLEQDVTVCRWGEVGMPLLIFPTAGGDAEEIERFKVIDTLAGPMEQGLIKIYSCDSTAGRVMLAGEGSPAHQMWILDQFFEFVRWELAPAIWTDCGGQELEIVTAGSSIGAFNALTTLCRYPEVFSQALCMSGTYDLQRFLGGPPTDAFYRSSPLHFVNHLGEDHLESLRSRFVLLASGEGNAEDIGESWRVAGVLGGRGIPNRVDSWGTEWAHDWPTWRNMLHKYVPDLMKAANDS
ncbi:MAG: alpha/beta hydrolase-fold protein [Gemmatimonadota bacterium]|nr:alpha/beta hydrolase-fold protein [Gemmatimonadota bacterium]